MRRRNDRSNSSKAPVTVSPRMRVRTRETPHRLEADPAVALPVRLMARR